MNIFGSKKVASKIKVEINNNTVCSEMEGQRKYLTVATCCYLLLAPNYLGFLFVGGSIYEFQQ